MVPFPDKRNEPRLLDHEINVKVSVRSFLRGLMLVLVLLGVFMLGRWSISPPDVSVDFSGLNGMFAASTLDTKANHTADKSAEPADESNSSEEIAASASSEKIPTTKTSSTASTTNESTSQNTSTTDNGSIITSYSKVAISLNQATIKWLDTYGKIMQVDFTIKNNEVGTVKPEYILMAVEGYDDPAAKRKISLPPSLKILKAGQIVSKTLNVPPQGFAYSETTAGDLHNIMIFFSLYDAKDTLMGSFNKEFDLSPK